MGLESYQTTVYYVECDIMADGCEGDITGVEDAGLAEDLAIRKGWTTGETTDMWICPNCQKKLK